MPADGLVGEVSLDPLRPEVPAGDVAAGIQHVDGVVAHVLHHRAEALLGRARLLFGKFPVGDVLADAEYAHRAARSVAVDVEAGGDRPPRTGRAPQGGMGVVAG